MILVALALAGCMTPAAVETVDPTPPTSGAEVAAAPEVTAVEFEVVGIGTPASTSYRGTPDGGPVKVGANATAILMEARWACETPTCELRLILFPPSGSTSESSTGTAEGSHLIEAPEAGVWNAHVRPEGAAKAQGEIRTTVFYGPIPAGYTAFP